MRGVDGKHCPNCLKDVGTWAIVAAPMPTWIRCPWCRSWLTYRPIGGVAAVAVFLGVVIAAAGIWAARYAHGIYQPLTFLAILVGAWFPVEFFLALYLRANKVLHVTKSPAPPP